MSFPSPPWQMRAQMWLSVFRVADTGRADRPPGVHGVAFVAYERGSTLTYNELLVARLVDARHRVATLADVWVDSVTSRDAGRALWAIPKRLADLEVDDRGLGPAAHTDLSARVEGRPVATGEFASLPGAAVVRAPAGVTLSQHHADGAEVRTPVRGSGRSLPALATWDFAADGPLGYLAGRRPLVSFRLSDVRLTVG